MNNKAITVNGLIAKLQTMSPDAQVEFEIPENKFVEELNKGDRWMIFDAQETFYNSIDNKWVVLT